MKSELENIEDLIKKARFFEARQAAEIQLKSSISVDDLRLNQLLAMATSKSGSPEEAKSILEPYFRRFPDDPETSGILAGIYKELFRINQDPQYGSLAYETYFKNYQLTKSYYTGINAASMSAIIGYAAKGRKIADEIISGFDSDSLSIWEKATLAEAWLLKKDKEKATNIYLEVKKEVGKDWGVLNSIRNQLWLLKHFIHVPREIQELFKPPVISAFIGHMVDFPNREKPRFPNEMVDQVRLAIRGAIETLDISIGYSSLACGSDILFAEEMLSKGNEVRTYLPFDRNEFIETSIRGGGEIWVRKFEELEKILKITYLNKDRYAGDDDLFKYQALTIFGESFLRAKQFSSEPELVTVLSSYDLSSGKGGTRDMLNRWPLQDKIHNVNIDTFKIDDISPKNLVDFHPNIDTTPIPNRKMSYILCANINTMRDSSNTVEKFISGFQENNPNQVSIKQKDEFYTIACQSSVLLMDFVWELAELCRNNIGSNSRYALHVGPIYDEENEFSGETMEITAKIKDSSSSDIILISKEYVGHLLLISKQYRFTFGGLVVIDDEDSVEIYNVQKGV